MKIAYYNRTRGPYAVTLATGASATILPKKWLVVTPEEDGSASLLAGCDRGDLIRFERNDEPVSVTVETSVVEAPEAAPEAPLVPEVVEVAEVASVEEATEESEEITGEAKASKRRKR